MNASELKKGVRAKIKLVEYGDLQNKLIEMGCFEGTSIRLLHIAPLGDPLAFEINGYLLGLRKNEAKMIQIAVD